MNIFDVLLRLFDVFIYFIYIYSLNIKVNTIRSVIFLTEINLIKVCTPNLKNN